MKRFEEFGGVKYDELIGNTSEPLDIYNIKISAELKRGDLVAANNFDGTFSLATSSDTSKVFAVATANFESDTTVAQGYVSGTFNREKINPSDTAIITALEPALYRQGIKLTSLKPLHGGI